MTKRDWKDCVKENEGGIEPVRVYVRESVCVRERGGVLVARLP